MADLTVPLWPKGYVQLCSGGNYPSFIVTINKKRMEAGLVPMDRPTSVSAWKINVKWYYDHYNPKDAKLKNPKAFGRALCQVDKPKHSSTVDKHFKEVGNSITPEVTEYWKGVDLNQITTYLKSQISVVLQDEKYKSFFEENPWFWESDCTSAYLKKDPTSALQDLLKGVQFKTLGEEGVGPFSAPLIDDMASTLSVPATKELKPLGENRKRGRGNTDEDEDMDLDKDDGDDVKKGGAGRTRERKNRKLKPKV